MNDDFLRVAKKAALEAGKIISKYSGKSTKKTIKYGDKSDFATTADIEAEKVVIKIISSTYPNHNIIAEESGGNNKQSEYSWAIDPLDGTIAFSQNIPYFTVSIGLLKNNLPILGVINHVSFNNLYWAVQGLGAFVNGKKITVSRKKELVESVGTLDYGHRFRRSIRLELYASKLITKIGYPFGFGSAAMALSFVANGTLDLYVNHAYPWDFVAGTVIVREAGGKVTDFEGNEPEWNKERFPIVASNGLIHEEILKALK